MGIRILLVGKVMGGRIRKSHWDESRASRGIVPLWPRRLRRCGVTRHRLVFRLIEEWRSRGVHWIWWHVAVTTRKLTTVVLSSRSRGGGMVRLKRMRAAQVRGGLW